MSTMESRMKRRMARRSARRTDRRAKRKVRKAAIKASGHDLIQATEDLEDERALELAGDRASHEEQMAVSREPVPRPSRQNYQAIAATVYSANPGNAKGVILSSYDKDLLSGSF